MPLDATLEKTLPQSLKAERSVLGAILLDNTALHAAQQKLRPDDFYRENHRKIYRAIEELALRGAAIDLITLNEELGRTGDLETVGGTAVVSALVDGVPRSANIEHYVKIVKEKSTLRQLIEATGKILDSAYEAGEECDLIIDDAERAIFRVAEERLRAGFVSINTVADSTLKALEELSARRELITGIGTGFQRLDELTSGLQKGELIIVAARPSMGKTAFCLNIAQHAALHREARIGIFSLEMSKEQLFQRMLCSTAHIDAHLLRTGRLKKEEWTKLQMTFETLAQVPIWIDDTAGLSIMEMRGKAMRLKAEHGLDLLIVDYLQLMQGRGRYESRQQEISDISRSLKELAKELSVPVVACSQLSRAPEQRGGDRKPQLSDLRESGAIEQDADTVLFIYRPELYGETEENRGKAEVLIRKQRNGPTGDVDLVFIKNYTLFANPEYERG
jgi:replicative DNA helicase